MGRGRRTSADCRLRELTGTLAISGSGLAVGVIIKLLDLYTTNPGNIFSELSVWIFLCTAIAVRSRTSRQAGVSVFGFCSGMLAAYYKTARLTWSCYSSVIARGWWIFDLLTPLLGYGVWHAGGRSRTVKLLAIGIVAVMPAAAVLLFDRLRIRDLLLTVLTAMVIHRERTARITGKERCLRGGV